MFDRSTLPNIITVGRVILAPVIFFLILSPRSTARLVAFILFVIAALSDLWDGYLARKHDWISDFGKFMDPLADKLLLVLTMIPIYLVSKGGGPIGSIPYWGVFPLWVLLVIFGREALITLLRAVAAWRGAVVPAARIGKYKAFSQNLFIGAAILWFALQTAALEDGWSSASWRGWESFHAVVLALTLLAAVVLTILSLIVYLWNWRSMERGHK